MFRTASLSSGDLPIGPKTGSNMALLVTPLLLPLRDASAAEEISEFKELPGRSTRSSDS